VDELRSLGKKSTFTHDVVMSFLRWNSHTTPRHVISLETIVYLTACSSGTTDGEAQECRPRILGSPCPTDNNRERERLSTTLKGHNLATTSYQHGRFSQPMCRCERRTSSQSRTQQSHRRAKCIPKSARPMQAAPNTTWRSTIEQYSSPSVAVQDVCIGLGLRLTTIRKQSIGLVSVAWRRSTGWEHRAIPRGVALNPSVSMRDSSPCCQISNQDGPMVDACVCAAVSDNVRPLPGCVGWWRVRWAICRAVPYMGLSALVQLSHSHFSRFLLD